MILEQSQAPPRPESPMHVRLEVEDLQALIDALRAQGYAVIAPTVHEGVIDLGEVVSVAELPAGLSDEQRPGRYRLLPGPDGGFFAHTVGPAAWKRFLQPPLRRLWQAQRVNGHFEISREEEDGPRYAFLGVRPCDLAAIQRLDRIFLGGQYVERSYEARRSAAFVIAVNCTRPGETCFCDSMKTGPQARAGFDLALTELCDADSHYFLAVAGSEQGDALLAQVSQRQATAGEIRRAERLLKEASLQMGRQMETDGLPELLLSNLEHPHWEEIAQRCLTCANCTMVCPTCFCATVEDVTLLGGEKTERWRKADSCFTVEFSHIYGGSIRQSAYARYRHWMVHKLATWVDQFGALGCVGCGRCITWCPVGIDITAEVQAFRGAGKRRSAKPIPSEAPSTTREVV